MRKVSAESRTSSTRRESLAAASSSSGIAVRWAISAEPALAMMSSPMRLMCWSSF